MNGWTAGMVLGGAIVLAGCGGDADAPDSGDSVPPVEPTLVTTAPRSTGATSSAAPTTPVTTTGATRPPITSESTMTSTVPQGNSSVAQAVADLAERLAVEPGEIEVVSVEEVDWPDAAIGCPQPGMAYAQVIVNGTRIVLRHGETEYAYHQGGSRGVFYCPAERVSYP